MKRLNILFFLVLFLVLNSLFCQKSYSQDESFVANQVVFDLYNIDLNGNVLNTLTALNITVSTGGSSTKLKPGVTFKANGASLILSDVNYSTGVISLVWTGNITDGKLTISGKLNPVSILPQLTITRIEAAGGRDITGEVTVSIKAASSSPPPATPTPTPTTTPISATPTPTPVTSNENLPSIKLSGPDILNVNIPRQRRAAIRVLASNFKKTTRCTAVSSDKTIIRVSPKMFPLGPVLKRGVLVVKVNPLVVSSILNGETTEESVTINVDCENGAEAVKEIIITSESDEFD